MQINTNPPITYTYNSDNELTAISDGTTYTYDSNGNMISKTKAGQTTTYYYDYENRLILIQFPDLTTADYFYDSYIAGRISCGSCGSNGLQKADIDVGGRRFSKITPTGVTTYYFYDGHDLILEYDSNWNMQYQCTYGPGIDNQISIYQAGQSYYYIKDMLGSIVAIADQSGTIIQTYKYDAWGTIITQTGSLNNPFTYTGREYDAESGLYYYRARYYDSVIGRFLQRDPLGLVDGPNVYVYVKNDPVNSVDPDGKYTWKLHGFSTDYRWDGIYYRSEKWKMNQGIISAAKAINKRCTKRIHGSGNLRFCNCLSAAIRYTDYQKSSHPISDPYCGKTNQALGEWIYIYDCAFDDYPDKLIDTIIHEGMHQCFGYFGCKMTEEKEEWRCKRMSKAIRGYESGGSWWNPWAKTSKANLDIDKLDCENL